QICLQRAEASTAGPKRGPLIEEGLHAIEKALEKAPGLPRALAIKGALYVRKAQAAANPLEKKAALETARESLSKAFADNPLLKRGYATVAGEAEKSSGEP